MSGPFHCDKVLQESDFSAIYSRVNSRYRKDLIVLTAIISLCYYSQIMAYHTRHQTALSVSNESASLSLANKTFTNERLTFEVKDQRRAQREQISVDYAYAEVISRPFRER